MANPSKGLVPVRFGSFEVFPESGELHKNGMRLKLSGQAIEVLITLLERPGQIVTRDELQHKLWPGASYGDFDHGLNAAVNRLRDVLADSATEPRFIETVPRRGYRFLAPVERTLAPSSAVETKKIVPKAALRWRAAIAFVLAISILGTTVHLLMQSRRRLPQVNIVQFTSLPGFEFGPTFSPDATQIAFAAEGPNENNSDIYVKAIGDEKILRITQPPGSNSKPQWSPDGRLIAYEHSSGNGGQPFEHAIFLMTSLGGGRHKLRDLSDAWDGYSSWSPDSTALAYDDKPAGESSGIFLVGRSGSPVRRLTSAPADMLDSDPAFSPDGRQIAFLRNTNDGSSPAIYLVAPSGGEAKQLTSFRRIGRLAWTADGRRIVFAALGFFPGENSLYSVRTAGNKPERIEFVSSDAFDPAISASGNKLAYATSFLDSNIWSVPLHSKLPAQKLIASTRMDMQANFSPDGSRLAFASNRDGRWAVWTCNADGTDPVQFSRERGGAPEWSPDGKYIVFDSDEHEHWSIVVARSDGTEEVSLSDSGFDRRAPSWSADGKWVYFTSNRSGRWEIWKTTFLGNAALQVTHNGGGYSQESRDGKFVYFQKLKPPSQLPFMLSPEIWKIPSGGGSEETILSVNNPDKPAGLSWFWRAKLEGIYFVDNSAQPFPVLKIYEFATRTTRRIRQLEKHPSGGPGLAVDLNGQSVLITQIDNAGSDIMLLENFH